MGSQPIAGRASLPPTQPVHATAVARFGPGGWRAVLIQGPSGAGKSDLALRLVGRGWRLIADDWTEVWASGGRLFATAPLAIAGRLEIRGLGIAPAPSRWIAPVALLAHAAAGPVERLPEPAAACFAGVAIPRLDLALAHASAADVVARATAAL